MEPDILRLTNDDEPGSLKPRKVRIVRAGLAVGEQPAVIARVDPPLDYGAGVADVVLVSRAHGMTIGDIVTQAADQPGRVFVCRYVGSADPVPDQLTRADVEILFWGLLGGWRKPTKRP